MDRRYLSRYRRYPYPGTENHTPESTGSGIQDIIKKIEDIPFPNQMEGPPGPDAAAEGSITAERANARRFSLQGILKHIGLEEIILVGLILLLLDEGVEDEFLLIILVYILVTGIE